MACASLRRWFSTVHRIDSFCLAFEQVATCFADKRRAWIGGPSKNFVNTSQSPITDRRRDLDSKKTGSHFVRTNLKSVSKAEEDPNA
jgi:hypothetical protein